MKSVCIKEFVYTYEKCIQILFMYTNSLHIWNDMISITKDRANRLGPIKASTVYHLSHNGTDERFTFGSFLYKKETYFSEWVSGKLQCEAFIGPKRRLARVSTEKVD